MLVPLFIAAVDFGRWISYWVIVSFIIYFSIPHSFLKSLFIIDLLKPFIEKINLQISQTTIKIFSLLELYIFKRKLEINRSRSLGWVVMIIIVLVPLNNAGYYDFYRIGGIYDIYEFFYLKILRLLEILKNF